VQRVFLGGRQLGAKIRNQHIVTGQDRAGSTRMTSRRNAS
jgi:hypothetical protein